MKLMGSSQIMKSKDFILISIDEEGCYTSLEKTGPKTLYGLLGYAHSILCDIGERGLNE